MSKLGLKHHLQNDHVDSRSKEVRSKKFDGRKKVYICTLCDFQTIFRKSLDKHQQIHLPPGERQQFPCAHCDKKYTSKTNVQHHLQNNHIDSRAKELNKLQKKVYRCSTCSYQARDMSGLRQHNLVHLAPEERQMFACAHCEKKYTLKRNLRRHLTDDHTDTRMKESQKNVHRCSTCSYQTRDISTLRQHEKLHLAPEERQMFVCTQCDKKFSRKYDLKRHLKRRIHSRSKVQKKIYRCAICSFQTKHRQSLHHHKKVHWAPEKRQMFTCAKCDKKYRLKKSLQCHLKRDHLDSRNSDSTSPTDEVILGSLKMEIDDYTPHLDDFKNAEHLAVTNKVKSEVFLKIEPDGVTPTMNTDMQDDFKNTENLSVTKKLYIKLEDFIKMEPKYDDEDARF